MAEKPRRYICHMCMDIQGFIQNHHSLDDYEGIFTGENGMYMSAIDARNQLFAELRKGRRVLPMGDCEGFDYQTGCPGHPVAEEPPR